jgi:hypothetical protein
LSTLPDLSEVLEGVGDAARKIDVSTRERAKGTKKRSVVVGRVNRDSLVLAAGDFRQPVAGGLHGLPADVGDEGIPPWRCGRWLGRSGRRRERRRVLPAPASQAPQKEVMRAPAGCCGIRIHGVALPRANPAATPPLFRISFTKTSSSRRAAVPGHTPGSTHGCGCRGPDPVETARTITPGTEGRKACGWRRPC